ncbi:O-antigen ligase family protein [Microbacterium oleivorans]|uniref:O-antigen ligase family protein n=1 Tax=Microbacterium oleivorans TaxID=273677 RepID=UPI0018D3CACC|nr:O-antigen ligase family protein [Microbacterium oleivorans]
MTASGWIFAAVTFFPALTSSVANNRLILVFLGLVVSVAAARRILDPQVLALNLVLTLFALAATIGVSYLAADALGDPLLATNIQRLLVVTPVMLFAGFAVSKTPSLLRSLAVPYVTIAAVNSGLAMVEVAATRSLFSRDTMLAAMSRDGTVRAVLASDHSLVLGTLIALAVPMCGAIRNPLVRTLTLCALLAGIGATGSRGPFFLAICFALVALVPTLRRAIAKKARVLVALAAVGLVGLAYMSIFVWSAAVSGNTGGDYSANYRWAIYSTVPEFLLHRPLGYGLGTFPAGQWLVQTEAFGAKDILQTLDSELVYSAFTLGWVGLLLVSVAAIVAVRSIGVHQQIGLTAALCSAAGFSLALHAWDGLGAIWVFLVGASFGVVWSSRQKHPQTNRLARARGQLKASSAFEN